MTLLLNLCHIYFKVRVDEGFCCALLNICPVFCRHEPKFWHEKWRSDPTSRSCCWHDILSLYLYTPLYSTSLPLLREKICDIFESRLRGDKEGGSLMQFFFFPPLCVLRSTSIAVQPVWRAQSFTFSFTHPVFKHSLLSETYLKDRKRKHDKLPTHVHILM